MYDMADTGVLWCGLQLLSGFCASKHLPVDDAHCVNEFCLGKLL